MTFSEFCNCFYLGKRKSSLQHYNSQQLITTFLMRNALGNEEWEKHYDSLDQGNRKKIAWFKGESSPDKDTWIKVRNNLDDEEFAKELEEELVDPTNKLLYETAKKFGIQDSLIDKRFLAQAVTAQFRAIAENYGNNRNIVPESYDALLKENAAKNTTAAEPEADAPETAAENKANIEPEKEPEEETEGVRISKERYRHKEILPYIGIIIIIILVIVMSIIMTKWEKEDEEDTKNKINQYLTTATTNYDQIHTAEKLYNEGKYPWNEKNQHQYYLYSAILKYEALDGTYGDQKERIAKQGLNLCQSIRENEKKDFPYYIATILQCHFFEALNYSTDDNEWTNNIKVIEDYFNTHNLNLQNSEDALLSSYGYTALINYYDELLFSDYKNGTEELYKKYVEYYNELKDNQIIVAYSTGSVLPKFNLDRFSAYSEVLFRLIELSPVEEYQNKLTDIISTCDNHIKYSSIPSGYDDVLLTSIKADAYYYHILIAKNEVDNYSTDYISNVRSNAIETYTKLLNYDDLKDWPSTIIIIKSILRMTKHHLWQYQDIEKIIQYGDFVLNPSEMKVISTELQQEWSNDICLSCYNMLCNNNYINNQISDLGKRAAEYLTPIDTYDLVITEEDIPVYQEFFENFPKEEDFSIMPEESQSSEETSEETVIPEENK